MSTQSSNVQAMTDQCWDKVVKEAERVLNRIYAVYEAFGDDIGLEADLDALWYEYRRLLGLLELACPSYVDELRRRVIAERDRLDSRLDILLQEDDPDFEEEVTRYGFLCAQAKTLGDAHS